NKNSRFTPYVPFPEAQEKSETLDTEEYISLYESANNMKDNVMGHIQNFIGRNRGNERRDEIKKTTILEKVLGAIPSLKQWSDELFEEILLEFERSKDVRRASTDMGVQILKFRSAIRKFVENVWNDRIDRCKRDTLKQAYVEGGREAVEKTLKASFLEFSQEYMSDADKERFNSLKQLSDLSFPAEWHPAARTMQRKIICHVGPTNSGKTYNALKCLETANSGLYCGPLRLLAHEVFERFNNKGIPCNLVTGEERRELEGVVVPLTSSTIEMANLQRQVDVAVIDEIQMISDSQRGWAWTQALFGLQAKEIHLCGEASAVPLVRTICESINEEVEVREYQRLSKLVINENSLNGDLKKIEKGDCVVTFSRKAIFSLKHEIEEATGLRCAVAYGGLPPETRAQQAKLFNDPESGFDVLVASDAVGMGLNLNIKRVVFETVKKYDGVSVKYVPVPQIKQIGGRAGRFGTINPVGYVTALEPMDLRYVHQAMAAPIKNLEMAGLQPTMEMVELFAHQLPDVKEFSSLLEKFEDLARVDGQYFLCNFHSQKLVANSIEHIPMTIPERFSFVTGPVNTSDVRLMKNIQKFAMMHNQSRPCKIDEVVKLPAKVPHNDDMLSEMESIHRTLMLYLWLSYRFQETFVDVEKARELKLRCENTIHESLQTLKIPRKRPRTTTKDIRAISKLEEKNKTERNKSFDNNKSFTQQSSLIYSKNRERVNPHFRQKPLRAFN
ncbi:7621_t:CDS:10, partial [Diversispora eburnea]